MKRHLPVFIFCSAIFIVTFGLYWQTRTFEFILLDDNTYVGRNPAVLGGLSWQGLLWALKDVGTAPSWHPLTYLSLMADVSLRGGASSGWMHLHNALVHAASAILLFLFLYQVLASSFLGARSGAPADKTEKRRVVVAPLSSSWALWFAFLAALAWSAHPLRVESVAWIASRKDVVCGFWTLLALLGYVRSGHAIATDRVAWSMRTSRREKLWLSLAMLCWFCAFAGKPTAMMFPAFALAAGLVLWRAIPLVRLLPFAIISGAMALFSIWAQASGGAVVVVPLQQRLAHLLANYGYYLSTTLIPYRLSLVYKGGESDVPAAAMLMGGAVLATGVILTIWGWRTRRYWLVAALFWVFAGLFPVSGFVGIGIASHADRFTYMPLMGVGLGVTCLLAQGVTRYGRRAGYLGSVVVLFACVAYGSVANGYISKWQNNFLIFSHAARSDSTDPMVWQQLGAEYANRLGNPDAGIECFRKALTLGYNRECMGQLALSLSIRGKPGDFAEVVELSKGLKVTETDPDAKWFKQAMAVVAMRERRWEDSVRWFAAGLKDSENPESAVLYMWYGVSLYNVGKLQAAAEALKATIRLTPVPQMRADAQMRLDALSRQMGPVNR
jgi:hypothetical protein